MTLTNIREELLAQHAGLRRLAAEVCDRAGNPSSAGASHELSRLLRVLGDAVDAHNLREEELLGDVVPTLDLWGSIRAALMYEHHRKEHYRLRDAVRAAAAHADFSAIVRAALPVIEELLLLLREEEAELLNPDVLRDDIISIDQADG